MRTAHAGAGSPFVSYIGRNRRNGSPVGLSFDSPPKFECHGAGRSSKSADARPIAHCPRLEEARPGCPGCGPPYFTLGITRLSEQMHLVFVPRLLCPLVIGESHEAGCMGHQSDYLARLLRKLARWTVVDLNHQLVAEVSRRYCAYEPTR